MNRRVNSDDLVVAAIEWMMILIVPVGLLLGILWGG